MERDPLIAEGNRTIATFMRLEVRDVYIQNENRYQKAFIIPKQYDYDRIPMWALFGEEYILRYHSDWNWFMDAWDVTNMYFTKHKKLKKKILDAIADVRIEVAFHFLVELIDKRVL